MTLVVSVALAKAGKPRLGPALQMKLPRPWLSWAKPLLPPCSPWKNSQPWGMLASKAKYEWIGHTAEGHCARRYLGSAKQPPWVGARHGFEH